MDFIRYYDVRKMTVGTRPADENDERRESVAKLIRKAGEAVDVRLLVVKAEALRMMAVQVGRRGRWFKGCDCHADLWMDSEKTHKRKQDEFRKQEPDKPTCVYRGKRATQMACDEIDTICVEIETVTSLKFNVLVAMCVDADRIFIVGEVTLIKHGLCEYYRANFSYYLELPWLIAALDAKRIGKESLVAPKAKVIVDKCRDLETSGTLHRAQRRTVAFWKQHKPYVVKLSRGEEVPHEKAMKMWVFIKIMALILCVTRWVEHEHSVVKRYVDQCRRVGPGLVSAHVRFAEHVVNLLRDPEGRAVVTGLWFSRNLYVQKFKWTGLVPGMRLWQQHSRIYGYHLGNLFKNNDAQVSITTRWNLVETATKTNARSESVGDEARLIIDYFNSVLKEATFFSVPSESLRGAVSPVGCRTRPSPPEDLLGVVTNFVDVAIHLRDSPDLQHPIVPAEATEMRVFQVVKTNPERRFDMPVSGVSRIITKIHCAEFLSPQFEIDFSLGLQTMRSKLVGIDLEILASNTRGEMFAIFKYVICVYIYIYICIYLSLYIS